MTAANSTASAQAAPSTILAAIREATHETLSLGDAMQYLADAEHEAMPDGLAHMLRVLARRAHDIGIALDGIKLDEVAA